MSDLRINARLDEQSQLDLQFLQHELSEYSVTDVVKYSLRKAAQDLKLATEVDRQKQIWRSSGFIGGFSGPEDLSVNYKQYIREILDEKYPHQGSDC